MKRSTLQPKPKLWPKVKLSLIVCTLAEFLGIENIPPKIFGRATYRLNTAWLRHLAPAQLRPLLLLNSLASDRRTDGRENMNVYSQIAHSANIVGGGGEGKEAVGGESAEAGAGLGAGSGAAVAKTATVTAHARE